MFNKALKAEIKVLKLKIYDLKAEENERLYRYITRCSAGTDNLIKGLIEFLGARAIGTVTSNCTTYEVYKSKPDGKLNHIT